MKMKFVEYIKFCIAHDLEFDAVIGDEEMPAIFCLCDNMKITDYCMEKYGDLLNSECEVKYDPSGRNTDVVIVDYPRGSKGAQLAYAIAGYISGHEYEKLFGC